MKKIITPLCLLLAFTACKKQDLRSKGVPQESPTQLQTADSRTLDGSGALKTSGTGYYITDWIGGQKWSASQSDKSNYLFINDQIIKQLDQSTLDKGAVLVFNKGYSFGASSSDQKPLGLPYYYYLPYERMAFPIRWESKLSVGHIYTVGSMNAYQAKMFIGAQDKFFTRYFVISPDYLKKYGLTSEKLHSMSYADLVKLFEVSY